MSANPDLKQKRGFLYVLLAAAVMGAVAFGWQFFRTEKTPSGSGYPTAPTVRATTGNVAHGGKFIQLR
jgi:hypothetical protein